MATVATPPEAAAPAPSGAPGRPLGLHEGNCPPVRLPDPRTGCKRWPEQTFLLNLTTGQLVLGRCKATNLCDYCAKLQAVENTQLLQLDALHGVAPNIVTILGTRTATLDMARFYDGRRKVLRAVRRRWPAANYAALLEFTTGYGPRSGGLRRPHWNMMWKGVPDDDLAAFAAVVSRVWCAHVDALPERQYVALLRDAGGFTKYVARHFQKTSQAPPEGFRGHRFTASKGYLWLPTPDAREAAREVLRAQRTAWRLQADNPELDAQEVHDLAQLVAALPKDDYRRIVIRSKQPKREPTCPPPNWPSPTAKPATAPPGGA